MESICWVCYLHSSLFAVAQNTEHQQPPLPWHNTLAASRAHSTVPSNHIYTTSYLQSATWYYLQSSPWWWQEDGLLFMTAKIDIHIDTICTIHTHCSPVSDPVCPLLHSALAPPAHKSCHVGFIFGEIGGELGWVEPDTPTPAHLARTHDSYRWHNYREDRSRHRVV